ncbi:iron-containing alcohol dehydrogenase [Lachnospiraceae bacterium LCP25S3_G4]
MKNFAQYTPTEIIFGKEAELQVGSQVKKWGGTRVLLVYGGGSVIRSGLLDRIREQLKNSGIIVEELGGVQPNPRLSLAEEGVQKALAFRADFILAVGGGSAIDTAKGIAHGTANPEYRLWDIWTGKVPLTKSMPIGVVLTLAAAGSETSDSAVLTNEDIHKKAGIGTDFNRPKFAIMNPELTYTLPRYQLTCGIVDIMMHTMDRYFTPVLGNQLTDEIAEAVLRVTIENGTKALENQTDYDAMSEIMWCGSLSHNNLTGLGGVKDFATHKLGHELSAKYDVAHGASLSAVWGSWARYVYRVNPERFAQYAQRVWNITADSVEEAALAGITRTEEYFHSLGMPICIGELEIGVQPEEEIRDMAKRGTGNNTFKVAKFKELDEHDFYEILKAANHR